MTNKLYGSYVMYQTTLLLLLIMFAKMFYFLLHLAITFGMVLLLIYSASLAVREQNNYLEYFILWCHLCCSDLSLVTTKLRKVIT